MCAVRAVPTFEDYGVEMRLRVHYVVLCTTTTVCTKLIGVYERGGHEDAHEGSVECAGYRVYPGWEK